MESYIYLIPLFPLIGAVINTIVGRQLGRVSNYLACTTVGLSFALSLMAFSEVLDGKVLDHNYFEWIVVGGFDGTLGFLIDPLSATMMLIVSGVSFLIHIYSLGYMHADPDHPRFFTYLNLFVFSMLMLVMGNNLLVMFFGWEGVGLCSYLLIGFWYKKKSASDAGKKAFIVNRIGDFGFGLGIFLIFMTFGSIHFNTVFPQVAGVDVFTLGTTVTAIGMLLFVGAVGKSAQIPLYVWLPDAMEGPTPVSALIHAATMVTAGVFMVARCNPFFSFDAGQVGYILGMTAGDLVALTGAVTAIFAATIALVQNDIKKVLAYSTVSQLGYMFIGVGVGVYASGIFHLVTHAFFKALLFLGAGSVIHIMEHAFHHEGMHEDPQDIRNMGGLFKHAKVTAITFLAAWIAISGLPFFSGFFSKDLILAGAYHENPVAWILGTAGALLTAFYMTRLVYLVFFGKSSENKLKVEPHLKESPWTMTLPLAVLALLSFAGGYLDMTPLIEMFGGHPEKAGWFTQFLGPVVGVPELHHEGGIPPVMLVWISIGVAVVGILFAFMMYHWNIIDPKALAERSKVAYRTLLNKYYVDELYDLVIVRPIKWTSESVLWKIVDVRIVDGFVNGSAFATDIVGRILRLFQTGYVQTYGFFITVGMMVVAYYVIFK